MGARHEAVVAAKERPRTRATLGLTWGHVRHLQRAVGSQQGCPEGQKRHLQEAAVQRALRLRARVHACMRVHSFSAELCWLQDDNHAIKKQQRQHDTSSPYHVRGTHHSFLHGEHMRRHRGR